MIDLKTRTVAPFSPDVRTSHNIYKLQKHVLLRHQSYLIVFMGNKNLRFWQIIRPTLSSICEQTCLKLGSMNLLLLPRVPRRGRIVFTGTCFWDISLLLLYCMLFTRPEQLTAFLICFYTIVWGSSCWAISSYLCFLCGSSGFSVFSYFSTFDIDIRWTTSYKMKN